MSMFKVRKPTCIGCEHHQSYGGMYARRGKGITLHLGDQYCDGGQRYLKLKKRQVMRGVHADCPILKKTPLLRIYCFKDSAAMTREKLFSYGKPPSAHEYAVRYQGDSPITAWALCEELEMGQNPLDMLLHFDEILEIDDGFCPYFFQNTEYGLLDCLFDREAALKNKLKQDTASERSEEQNG